MAVRPGTRCMIGGVEPIGDIVEPCVPRQTAGAVEGTTGPVRDFVLVVASRTQEFHRVFVHRPGHIVVRHTQSPALDLCIERCRFFEDERVDGEVVDVPRSRLGKCIVPIGEGLTRQPKNEVEIDRVEADRPRVFVAGPCLGGGMDAAEHTQQGIVQALHAHADAIDPHRTKLTQVVFAQYRARIAFDGDFGAGKRHDVTGSPQNLLHLCERQHTRCAAAEEDGRWQVSPQQWVRAVWRNQGHALRWQRAEFVDQSGAVGDHPVVHIGIGVEVAICTAPVTKGNMNIQVPGTRRVCTPIHRDSNQSQISRTCIVTMLSGIIPAGLESGDVCARQ